MNRTFIRSNQAAKLTGISRARIYQDMRRGVLSVSVDAHGKVQLDDRRLIFQRHLNN